MNSCIMDLKWMISIVKEQIISSNIQIKIIVKEYINGLKSIKFLKTKINEFIKKDLNRDFTYWDAKGGYDDSRTYIIYTALTKYELLRLERYMKTYDDHAFMVKSEGVGIKGEFEKKF